jgi:glycosyltransferase involved in cell wall biosynthesis
MQKLASAATLRTRGDIRDFMLKGSIGSISDILTAHATDKIICPSSNLAALIRSYCLVDEEKTVVVPNGIDLEIFSKRKCEDATTCLKQYGLEEDNYVLFVGRLSVLKGVQYLIEAFRSFSLEHPNVKLAIVGSGDFESNLKRLAHGIRNIVFTGHVSSFKERKVLFENSLFVVVPSLYETFPMVLLEGMACSKAVIASNVGGIPSIIRHGKNGFLSRAGDHEDIAKFIKILYGDKRLRDSMGSLGRELVERNFSVDQMINQTLLVYQSLF